MDELSKDKSRLIKSITVFMWILALVSVATFFFLMKANKNIDAYDRSTITVTGTSERFLAPDIARLYFGVQEEGKTVSEAQDKVKEKMNKALDFLKEQGVEEKDIRTTNYNISPKYEYFYEK